MIDILPRFTDGALRLRLAHLQPGKELSILIPQAIASAKRYPAHKQFDFTDKGLLKPDRSPSLDFVDLIVKTTLDWLNEDVLLWCQYGAKLKLNKIANTYTLTLYPYPPI